MVGENKHKLEFQSVNEKCLVSIIVPVYLVEEFLDDCIESLLQQTVDGYEIILVDDGSTDSCPEICDRYAEYFEHIYVIHQTNKGISSARNAGVLAAKGKYIAFCDSDDAMKPSMLEKMTVAAETHDSDIVICGYETFPNGKSYLPAFPSRVLLTPQHLINSCKTIHSGNEFCFSWRFLIKRSFLQEKGLLFDETVLIGEDMLLNTCAILEARSIIVLDEALYLYRINNVNSVMRKKYKPDLEQKLQLQYEKKIEITKKYSLEQNKAWMEDLTYYYITGFAGMLFRNAMNGPVDDRKAAIKRAIRLPMLQENYRRMGKLAYKAGKKNVIFRLACKYKFDPIVIYFVEKCFV